MKLHNAPVSVVIPAHNAEAFIEEAIRSVQAQSLAAAEIIVVADDCSDRTSEIATAFGAKVIHHNRRNMAAALNVAVEASSQPWIALLDADDYWDGEKLAWQFKAIEAFPSVGLVSCDYFQVEEGSSSSLSISVGDGTWVGANSTSEGCCRFISKPSGDLLSRLDLLTICTLVRRDVFDRVGFFNEQFLFGQTMEFFARGLAYYPLVFVEKPLAYHRRHKTNHTNNLEGYWPMHISIVDRMLKHPEDYPAGAGEAYRTRIKGRFHQYERGLWTEKVKRDQPNNPNQP